jgi:hypothetical protein
MMRYTAALLLVATATLSLSSCDGVTSPRSDLEQARTRWAERGPSDYSIVVSRSCFCAPVTTDPVVVTVAGGVIVSRVYAASGDTVPPAYASVYPDIAQLFDIIDEAIAQRAAHVDVTYEPDFGYPVSVFIDQSANAADDEISYDVTSLSEPLQ